MKKSQTTRAWVYIILSSTLLSLLLFSCDQVPEDRLPNIVIIFIDDMGYGDLGSYGATKFETPHLDRMASEGMRFTNFYAAQAVCSASRAAILTGCYPNRIGVSGAYGPNAKVGIHENEMTIAEMLKEKGYSTGIVGKWHLGHLVQFLPLQNGFDEYLGIPYSNDMWPVYYDGGEISDSSINPHRRNWPVLPLIEGNEKIEEIRTLDDQAKLTTLYTERAVRFIHQHQDGPFFLYLPHTMVHVPLGVSEKFKGKSQQGLYGDVMMEIDWSVGEILRTLDELGLQKNTLVLFTSDNGPWLNYGNHAGSTGGLREGKGTSFEGGQRVPCIARWPGKIPAGVTNNKLAATIDFLPTIADITGSPLPDQIIDGVSILPLLQGDDTANPRNHFYYYYRRNSLEAVRKDHWKLVLPHPHRSYEGVVPANDGFPGPYAWKEAEYALYDLRRDPGERYDVKELYPEIVAELEILVEAAREDLGDDLTNREGKNVREIGRLLENNE